MTRPRTTDTGNSMREASYIRRRGFVARACAVLLLLSLLALFACLCVGSAPYALREVWEALCSRLGGGEVDATATLVLWGIRLPRSLLAYVVGAALAVSGTLMQGVFRNPMAEPGLLGVSSGAALGAAAAMLLNLQASFWGFSAVSLCAFAGGALAVLLVMGIAGLGRGGLTTLLLCGVAVSSFLSALLSGLLSINHEALESVYMWTLGSFASASYGDALPRVTQMWRWWRQCCSWRFSVPWRSRAISTPSAPGATRVCWAWTRPKCGCWRCCFPRF